MKKIGVTAVIITKNEERNIGRCLHSLQDVADEIIVLDSQSEDRTREICAEFSQVTFVDHPWLGYGATKNAGNVMASMPYILSMDADEALSEELRASILALKDEKNIVYEVNRKTNYCGKWINHCGWYPDSKIRLFPKESAQWNLREVHESLEVNSGYVTRKLTGDLHHYSYYSIREHVTRAAKYAEFAAGHYLRSGKKMLGLRMLISPQLKFWKVILLRGGYRDGIFGWVIAVVSAFEVFLKFSMAIVKRRQQ